MKDLEKKKPPKKIIGSICNETVQVAQQQKQQTLAQQQKPTDAEHRAEVPQKTKPHRGSPNKIKHKCNKKANKQTNNNNERRERG